MGNEPDGDPTLWRIVDGRLNLNGNAPAQEIWLRHVPGGIAKADAIWSMIKDRPADALQARYAALQMAGMITSA